jgi:alkylation response protein AidB-like acyl-CoA dehydrogenase
VDLEFTSEQEELRASVRSFLDKECTLAVVRDVVETGNPPAVLWQSMVALDWPALNVPEEDGGIGLTFVETAVVVEELGRSVAPGPLLTTVSQFVPIVIEAGTAAQRHQFLSDVASGVTTGAIALADHPTGWSLGDVTMAAERAEGGWVLDGTKHGVMVGHGVDELAVVARVGEGLGVFIVPSADAGLSAVNSLDASRPVSTVSFERVLVPDERVLGAPGSIETTRAVVRAVEEATAALALETVGACDALFQMVLAVERARSLCYFAVAAIAEDTPQRAAAVAMAKAASDDCQHLVCRESLQSFGGIGFTWEHDGHFFMKRATADGALFGGAPLHSLTVAASLETRTL